MDTLVPIASVVLGFASGFLGTTVGGGGLLVIPCLLALGLPGHVAVTTFRFSDIGFAITSLPEFRKSKQILWRYALLLTVLNIGGLYLGTKMLLSIDTAAFRPAAAVLLLVLLFVLWRKEEIGAIRIQRSIVTKTCSGIFYFGLQIFGGFFPAGTGPLTKATLMAGLGFTALEARATEMVPFLIANVITIVWFAGTGLIDFAWGVPLFIGSMVGGFIGARLAIQKGALWLKRAFMLAIGIMAMYLLYSSFF